MYIRRKVFSVALDESGEERYFSTNEIINEEDYLNEVMYSDYDEDDYLDEYMYSDEEESGKKSHLGRNIALGTAGTAALAGAGIYGAKKIGAKQERLWKAVQLAGRDKTGMTTDELKALKEMKKDKELMKKVRSIRKGKKAPSIEKVGANIRRGKSLQKPADKITGAASTAGNWIAEKAKKGGSWTVENAKRGGEWVKAHPGKTAAIAAGTAAVGAAGIYGAKKLKERRANRGSED